mmetsp:Transcript_43133/g.99806  ORF Transcript_43133/g.99806 Transcript_43133/m.99806 type:complete len:422 (+) Transcript_43133:1344-2609(+)
MLVLIRGRESPAQSSAHVLLHKPLVPNLRKAPPSSQKHAEDNDEGESQRQAGGEHHEGADERVVLDLNEIDGGATSAGVNRKHARFRLDWPEGDQTGGRDASHAGGGRVSLETVLQLTPYRFEPFVEEHAVHVNVCRAEPGGQVQSDTTPVWLHHRQAEDREQPWFHDQVSHVGNPEERPELAIGEPWAVDAKLEPLCHGESSVTLVENLVEHLLVLVSEPDGKRQRGAISREFGLAVGVEGKLRRALERRDLRLRLVAEHLHVNLPRGAREREELVQLPVAPREGYRVNQDPTPRLVCVGKEVRSAVPLADGLAALPRVVARAGGVQVGHVAGRLAQALRALILDTVFDIHAPWDDAQLTPELLGRAERAAVILQRLHGIVHRAVPRGVASGISKALPAQIGKGVIGESDLPAVGSVLHV